MNHMEKSRALAKLADIDIGAINEELKRVEEDLYKEGLIDWRDTSWEHPDPRVSAVFGDLHRVDLDARHGFCAPYLDSCEMCGNPACDRLKDDGWTCNHFRRGIPA